MRVVEVGVIAACALVAGLAAAHGVHDQRGEARLDRERLIIELGDQKRERCLRFLDELEVRSEDGVRLAGSQDFDASSALCRLEYLLAKEQLVLTLRLRPAERGFPRNERLVLAAIHDGSLAPDPLILTSRGNWEQLPTTPPRR